MVSTSSINNKKGVILSTSSKILIFSVVGLVILIAVFLYQFGFPFGKGIKGVPKEVNQFLSNTDVNRFVEQGFTIYRGTSPPNIEGSYLLNNNTLVYDPQTWANTYPLGYVVSPYIYTFSEQKPDGSIKASFISEEADDRAEGLGGFISGEGNCFTLFVGFKGNLQGCNYDSPKVFSACLVEGNLTNIQDSWYSKDKDKEGCDNVMPIGYLRIYEEKDGSAERQN